MNYQQPLRPTPTPKQQHRHDTKYKHTLQNFSSSHCFPLLQTSTGAMQSSEVYVRAWRDERKQEKRGDEDLDVQAGGHKSPLQSHCDQLLWSNNACGLQCGPDSCKHKSLKSVIHD